MQLNLAAPSGNVITAYGDRHVVVNGRRYERSLIVLRDRVIEDWDASGDLSSFEQLSARHFEFLASLGAEVVILGTGESLRFPHPRLSASLAAANIGMEAMDTRAACRTYNILLAEGRAVAAALLLEYARTPIVIDAGIK